MSGGAILILPPKRKKRKGGGLPVKLPLNNRGLYKRGTHKKANTRARMDVAYTSTAFPLPRGNGGGYRRKRGGLVNPAGGSMIPVRMP